MTTFERILGIGLILEFWAATLVGNIVNMSSKDAPSFFIAVSGIVIIVFTIVALVGIIFLAIAQNVSRSQIDPKEGEI